ncbi:hypothetical protein HMPREF3202_00875 [Prevotella bivia]|uniref:Uncharacterized protein n=1 Tax=Prevotella bivia TaxID=28125 RepID=A0A137SYZ5_9BACT|nr:hypothetical protein HMPREF3202_00875 [Prevotella bivia]
MVQLLALLLISFSQTGLGYFLHRKLQYVIVQALVFFCFI